MPDEKIIVKTFGGFELVFHGQKLQLERNTATKASHLLQYLIYNWDKNFTKNELVNILYSDNEVTDPVNNLKVNIFRLRKMLLASGLPQQEYILYKNGCYGWNKEIPVEIDAHEFDRVLNEAVCSKEDQDRRFLYRKAMSLYKGEFLPILRHEEWASIIREHCRQRYMEAVEEICRDLEEENNQEEIMCTATTAAEICPYEERIYLIQLHSLIRQQHYQEAMILYDEVSSMLMDEMGISPSEEMTSVYRQITVKDSVPVARLEEIRDCIQEKDLSPGAYHCNYPVFIDSCRVLSRMEEHSGQSVYLVLCTIKDGKGIPLKPGERLRNAAMAMHQSIRNSLRKYDLYTRYGPCQFLMLLLGVSRTDCKAAAERIEKCFHQGSSTRGIRLKWEYELISGRECRIKSKLSASRQILE